MWKFHLALGNDQVWFVYGRLGFCTPWQHDVFTQLRSRGQRIVGAGLRALGQQPIDAELHSRRFVDIGARDGALRQCLRLVGHGERPRSQLLLKLAGAENGLILAVNTLGVNGALHFLYSVKKCLVHSIERQKVS